jgi:hypothetical protein
VNVGDLHHKAGGRVGVHTFLRQLAGDFDLELKGEVTEVATILVACDDRARWCWRWFLGSRVPRQRPHETDRSHHHAGDAGYSASATID